MNLRFALNMYTSISFSTHLTSYKSQIDSPNNFIYTSSYIISLDLPERKLPLSHGGLNGANKTRATDNLVSTWESLHCSLVALTNDALKTKCQLLNRGNVKVD